MIKSLAFPADANGGANSPNANSPGGAPMKRVLVFLVLSSAFCVTGLPQQKIEVQKNLKSITLFLEGDSSTLPKFINLCRQMGPERGLDFKFVDRKEDGYDYRVILSTEGSGVWNFAHGNIVVMNPEAKVLFTVTRSNRWTAKGATSALTKEFVKVLARYIGTHQ